MKTAPRAAYTLFELMLVMAILAMMGAMAIPSLSGSLSGYRLRRGADLVRAKWVATRNEAIRSGQIQVFRFQIDGDRFWSEPWYAEGDPAADTLGGASPVTNIEETTAFASYLPKDILFVTGETESDSRSIEIEDDFVGGAMGGGSEFGRPIVFYPDGTTSTSRVYLTNERGHVVDLSLRGLTGVAEVSDINSTSTVTSP